MKSLYHFGNRSYVLMSLAYIFRLQPLEVFDKTSIRLQEFLALHEGMLIHPEITDRGIQIEPL